MLKINAKTFASMLKQCYYTKLPLLVVGAPGIGKSQIPVQEFTKVAKEKERKFVHWDKISKDKKLDMLSNPEKYFCLCDQRLSQMDTSDLRGIPKIDSDYLDNMTPMWINYFANNEADGVIFFDEINLAPPIIVSTAYQIINDRSISDKKISDNVLMIAAGNREEDRAYTFDLPLPLRDRFCEAELIIDPDVWIEWAQNNGVNPFLISYIKWKPAALYNAPDITSLKATTPRGIVRASQILDGISFTNLNSTKKTLIKKYLSITVGEAFALEFLAYLEYYSELDWNVIFNDPKIVKKYYDKHEIGKVFAIASGLINKFLNDVTLLDTILKVAIELPMELGAYVSKGMRVKMNIPEYKKAFSRSNYWKDVFTQKLGNYLV